RPGPAHAARGEEVIEDRPPLGGVENLRVELNGVELALLVRHRRHRAVRSSGKGHEALGWLKNGVAVAHPDRDLSARFGLDTAQERTRSLQGDFGLAVLPALGGNDVAAQEIAHRLHPLANAPYRETGVGGAFP